MCDTNEDSLSSPDVTEQVEAAKIRDAPPLSVIESASLRDSKYDGKPRPG